MGPVRARHEAVVVDRDGLEAVIAGLREEGYRLLGPVVRDGAIVYDDVARVEDLPAGWTDRQEPGATGWSGAATKRCSALRSGRNPGSASSIRRSSGCGASAATIAAPPWTARRRSRRSSPSSACGPARSMRSASRTGSFLDGPFVDQGYAGRRRDTFVVAVNCSEPGGTCFCVSMKTGPKADSGYDLALTELHRRRPP